MNAAHRRLLIRIRGIVQGVGFRPFVYREARGLGICGSVRNTPEGVLIDAQGEALERFIQTLRERSPEHARIDAIETEGAEPCAYDDFEICDSTEGEGEAVILPDLALCDACAAEMDDPSNRRYRYAFINCTDCGPRYTIMQIPPYDRVRTSMKHFEMCGACEAEYTDPASRRFHAEAIGCSECGPQMRGIDAQGNPMEGETLNVAAAMLREGKIVALKGIGGFHLMCDGTNAAAIEELRRRKHRPAKPLAVMFSSLEQVRRYADLTPEEAALIEGALKPIVIVKRRGMTNLSEAVAPRIGRIGVFLPYTPLHRLLFERIDFPLVVTSANRSDEPIFTRSEEVIASALADGIVDHNRSIVNPLDDSVVQLAAGNVVMLRMGRGYAPYSMRFAAAAKTPCMALGAQQKSAIALALSETLVLGGHIGDLGSIEAEGNFERNVHTFKRFYGVEPRLLITDAHPFYTSVRYAAEQKKERFSVQHHYAHILACMAEYALSQKVLGFAFDGNGYGEGGVLWGGEAMIADVHGYERIASLKPFPLLGGEKALREPRRIALALLFDSYRLDEVLALRIPTTEAFFEHEIRLLHHAWEKRLNAPLSSSMGRLFDAVASLGGFVQTLSYEGEGGMIMENWADEALYEPLGFRIAEGKIDVSEMISQIVGILLEESDTKVAKRHIAGRFICTVEAMIRTIADAYPDLSVVVAGGVFQNRVLMERLYRRFEDRRFYAQRRTPINDGGLALGQAWWGIHNL